MANSNLLQYDSLDSSDTELGTASDTSKATHHDLLKKFVGAVVEGVAESSL